MYGKKHSKESKEKMSLHRIGKTAGEKNGMYGKTGELALNGKHVQMYDSNMTYIRTFRSKAAILQFLNLKGHLGLDKAIREQSLYKGYFWKQIDKFDQQ